MLKYLPIIVLSNSDYDCTNNGVSVINRKDLVIEAEHGNLTEQDIENKIVMQLIKKEFNGVTYYHLKQKGDQRWLMAGGNFAYSSDSRFPSVQPIAIHDRHE